MTDQRSTRSRGEVYVDEGPDGFFVVHMSANGDSFGVERGYPNRLAAENGAIRLANALGAPCVPFNNKGTK